MTAGTDTPVLSLRRRWKASPGRSSSRLARGVRRLTWRGCHAIARAHSGVCRTYTRGKMDVFTSLNGLFWWNDGVGETRRRLLLLAWQKGLRP